METPAPTSPAVTVLLATHNGERFLDEQLASLAAQDVARLAVLVSDDGSTDGTREILEAWRRRWTKGTFELRPGPCRGFAENFRSMLQGVDGSAGYVAFCDQDDVWDIDKLSAALATLGSSDRPALYGSRTRLVAADGRDLGYSRRFVRPPHFRNALVQNIAGGNTMVLNPAAVRLVAESARRTPFVSHDWWCYLLVSGAGGDVHYDPVPHISYRQHGRNLVGDNAGVRARLERIRLLVAGRFAAWNDSNLAALAACAELLTPEARESVSQFKCIRANPGFSGLALLHESGIYRQNMAGNLSLAAASLIGKV